jgi:hypothetical protein
MHTPHITEESLSYRKRPLTTATQPWKSTRQEGFLARSGLVQSRLSRVLEAEFLVTGNLRHFPVPAFQGIVILEPARFASSAQAPVPRPVLLGPCGAGKPLAAGQRGACGPTPGTSTSGGKGPPLQAALIAFEAAPPSSRAGCPSPGPRPIQALQRGPAAYLLRPARARRWRVGAGWVRAGCGEALAGVCA